MDSLGSVDDWLRCRHCDGSSKKRVPTHHAGEGDDGVDEYQNDPDAGDPYPFQEVGRFINFDGLSFHVGYLLGDAAPCVARAEITRLGSAA